jgi:SAM-dependent methyltransferase
MNLGHGVGEARAATIETVKAYWNARPCNVRHSEKPLGSQEYFDEVEKRKYFVESHIPKFAEFALWKDKKVLEVGCGIGTDTINFARAGANVTAVDLSEESLKIARLRAEVFGLSDRINFQQANAEELEAVLEPQQFDLVYSFGVLHHTPNPAQAIASLRKYMGRASQLRLMVYAKNSWKRILIDAGFDQPEAQSGCPIAFTYMPEDIPPLLQGFKILKLEQDHIFPFDIEKYRRYGYEVVPWFAFMPREMFRALEKALGWHMLVTAQLETA